MKVVQNAAVSAEKSFRFARKVWEPPLIKPDMKTVTQQDAAAPKNVQVIKYNRLFYFFIFFFKLIIV